MSKSQTPPQSSPKSDLTVGRATPAAQPLLPESLTDTLAELAAWLETTTLEELELEHAGLRVRLRKPGSGMLMSAPLPAPTAAEPSTPAGLASGPDAAEIFKAPLVGTFYSAPSPEAGPFVKVGDAVKEGQVIGIIEAMKTMNQLTAERSGTVRQVLVANASPVEFGQPLFVIS